MPNPYDIYSIDHSELDCPFGERVKKLRVVDQLDWGLANPESQSQAPSGCLSLRDRAHILHSECASAGSVDAGHLSYIMI